MSNIEMIWGDLETTGLDANQDVPLELALVATDRYGRVIAEKSWLVYEHGTPDYLLGMSRLKGEKFVLDMHTENGLLDDLKNEQTYTRHVVDTLAVKWLDELAVADRTIPLSGSSVGSLDRPFILQHFPKLNMKLHYRNIDISSVKELCRLRNPILLENIQTAYSAVSNGVAHRALDDCYASIDEYLAYADEFLITEDR